MSFVLTLRISVIQLNHLEEHIFFLNHQWLGVAMVSLIEGLSDDVVIRCLAYVPYYQQPKLMLVSRSWRAVIRSQELFKARKDLNITEDLLCVCAFEPENLWQLYDPLRDHWITLPLLPSKTRHLSHFGVVSTSGKLFVFGGGSDAVDPTTGDHHGSFATNDVWSYDPVTRQWTPRAPMLVPRSMFACCVLNGKIIVAGGFTSCRKSISQAEIYDPDKNTWTSLPDLHRTHNSACSGIILNGKLHVLHKGLSTVQVLEIEEFPKWTVNEYGWLQRPIAVVREKLYVMRQGNIFKQEGTLSKVVVTAPELRNRIGSAMIGFKDEVYFIGGVVGPNRLNWSITPLSEVNILAIGNEKPIWRQGSPMTKCRGTILGCTQLTL